MWTQERPHPFLVHLQYSELWQLLLVLVKPTVGLVIHVLGKFLIREKLFPCYNSDTLTLDKSGCVVFFLFLYLLLFHTFCFHIFIFFILFYCFSFLSVMLFCCFRPLDFSLYALSHVLFLLPYHAVLLFLNVP